MSIEKTIVTLIRDVPPLIWHSAWWGLLGRAEHARDNVTRPWLAACQPAPGAQPDTDDAASARVELVGVELELIHARAQLKRWDRRWELSRRVVKRLQTELDAARADVVRLTTAHDAADDDALKSCIAGEHAEEIEKLRAEVDRLLERGVGDDVSGYLIKQRNHWRTIAESQSTHIQELVEQREKHWAELEQCICERDEARAQLADAAIEAEELLDENTRLRAALPMDALQDALASGQTVAPVAGQTVTLRMENGKSYTGPLEIFAHRWMVRGWYADLPGRSLVPTPAGGEHR